MYIQLVAVFDHLNSTEIHRDCLNIPILQMKKRGSKRSSDLAPLKSRGDVWPLRGGTVKLKTVNKRRDKGKQWKVDIKDTVQKCILRHIYGRSEVFQASHLSLWCINLPHTLGLGLTATSHKVNLTNCVQYCKKPVYTQKEKDRKEKKKKNTFWGKLCIYLWMGSK